MSEFKSWDEMSEHEQLASMHYDFYKEVRGIRPRWFNYEALTVQELIDELAFLQEESKLQQAQEAEEQKIAIREFEELVESTMKHGARSREHALRWIAEAEQYNGDWDHICYRYGLPFGYFNQAA